MSPFGFLWLQRAETTLPHGAQASHAGGFSCWWLLLLQSTGSRACGLSSCGSWALEHRLSSCWSAARGIFLDQG